MNAPLSSESVALPRLARRWSSLAVPATCAVSIAAAVVVAGCGGGGGGGGGAPAGGPAGGGMPPPAVGVVTVQPQAVPVQVDLPGRVEALRSAQVRARVNGVVQKRAFAEGSVVKAGELLFLIDPAPYQAALDSARATLARAEANLVQAKALAERYAPLAEAKAVSQQDFVSAKAAAQQAEADVAAGRAAVQTARLNLDYARVTAPIAGRVGRALVTEGALVTAAEATPLALIQQVDRVYVNFTQSQSELLRLRKAMSAGQLKAGQAAVRIALDDGSELPQPGKLLFSDLSVDTTSGQVTLRAEVPNPDQLLLPGQYVRVRLQQAELPSAMLVPQQAVTRGAQADTLMVVGEGDKPQVRPVKLGGAVKNQWVVLDGLKPGEQVIVDGFQKMMVPGAPVKPVPWSPNAAPAGPGAAAAASVPASAASR